MKKVFTLLAVVAALVIAGLCTSSCTKEVGTYTYHVDFVNYSDNMDILRSAFDEGFQKGGLKLLPIGSHYWSLEGEGNACNKKAISAFQSQAEYLDKNRPVVILSSLALKGVTVKLIEGLEPGEKEIASYTFKEEDK
ncbi:MAG: hypothetical protein IK074_05790 [Bacteroidales bacterium]|nr:hypothetical protein [Bacteroidales bacterium]